MCETNAPLEHIGAHVERIDARVCRMERDGPSRVPPASDAAGPLPVAVRARAVHLLDLPAKLLVTLATHLPDEDELAFALACRRLHQTVAGTDRRAAGARLSTRIGSAFCSVGKLEWAVVSSMMSISGSLLLRVARAGQLEQLSCLRARGCSWELCGGVGKGPCSSIGCGRASRRAAVSARGWLPVGHIHVLLCLCGG
jgi:hypothetical protein